MHAALCADAASLVGRAGALVQKSGYDDDEASDGDPDALKAARGHELGQSVGGFLILEHPSDADGGAKTASCPLE